MLEIFPFLPFRGVFLLVSLFLYFLPAFLARNKPNFTAILLLNFFLGWTFIGWIVALIWALSSEPQRQGAAPPQASVAQPAAGAGFFCSACGKRCTAGEHYCSSCGATLTSTQR